MDWQKYVEFIEKFGYDVKIRPATLYTTCPKCGRNDKFSVRKSDGATVCYHGSCTYGSSRPFHYWIAAVKKISLEQAKTILFGIEEAEMSDLGLDLKLDFHKRTEAAEEEILPIEWPPEGVYKIDGIGGVDGASYLNKRGIPSDIALKYDIRYSPKQSRVFFPILMDDECYGYQARHIDKVDAKFRMRNNEGYQRGQLVMFYNNLTKSSHAIIAEGPIDALKFDKCGGNIATLGKVVTDKQLQSIIDTGIEKIFLALDEDANIETINLFEKITLPVYKVELPESVKQRCKTQGKKADFGECTFDECFKAFNEAEELDQFTAFSLNLD